MPQPGHLKTGIFVMCLKLNISEHTDFLTTFTILQRSVAVRPRDTLMFGDLENV